MNISEIKQLAGHNLKQVDIKDILYTISTWQVEASSRHNDGSVVDHYLQKIHKVQDALDRINKPKVIT